jgi:hypothetical protein
MNIHFQAILGFPASAGSVAPDPGAKQSPAPPQPLAAPAVGDEATKGFWIQLNLLNYIRNPFVPSGIK